MNIFIEVMTFLKDNVIALGVLGTSIVAIINFTSSTSLRRNELKQKRFENYHSLVDRLNTPETMTGYPLLDKQKSAIFEMRFYPEYRELTLKLLKTWIERSEPIKEMSYSTLQYLKLPIDTKSS